MKHSPIEVRDPIHGAISISRGELEVLDHPLLQRLRHIKQLGFSDLSFPGATHNRYLHSVGAMHLAGRAFDAIFPEGGADGMVHGSRRAEMRRLVRIAALLHDVGHAPFSHASEFAMPPLGLLDVPAYREQPEDFPVERQASHEDYTIKIITDSSLTSVLESVVELPALAVAGLVEPSLQVDQAWYRCAGVDFRPLLQQLISSELDVDRMDYLARDSHFAGVHYGVFDVGWLMAHLSHHLVDDSAYLALKARAIYAFDDFLIARYHMFLMVYFHHRSVGYEEMLKRYFQSGGDGYALPHRIEDYARFDDVHMSAHLRSSDNEWARRIVERREYKLLLERHGEPHDVDLGPIEAALAELGIPTIHSASKGVLSKYFAKRQNADSVGQGSLPLGNSSSGAPEAPSPIYVLGSPYRGAKELRAVELEESTELFNRYDQQLLIHRLYVPLEQVEEAGARIAELV
ncbi:MAG: hydrolase [Rickettsiales bacterium]|nr:hydrolase [Rickettsiales bacterium]